MVEWKDKIPRLPGVRRIAAAAQSMRRGAPVVDPVTQKVFKAISDYQKEISKQVGMPPKKFTERTRFVEDLGFDSLDMVELGEMLKEAFKLHVPDNADLSTVGDAVNYVRDRISPAERAKMGLPPFSMDLSHLSEKGKVIFRSVLSQAFYALTETWSKTETQSDILKLSARRLESEEERSRLRKWYKERYSYLNIPDRDLARMETLGDFVNHLFCTGFGA